MRRAHLSVIDGGLAKCPHLHVERRVNAGMDGDWAWVSDIDYCLDCKSIVERPWFSFTPAP